MQSSVLSRTRPRFTHELCVLGNSCVVVWAGFSGRGLGRVGASFTVIQAAIETCKPETRFFL